MDEKFATGELRFSADGKRIIRRTYLKDQKGLPPSSLWADVAKTGHTRGAKNTLKQIFGSDYASDLFATPKPVPLIEYILSLATDEQSLILDSFAGSGTTAHGVLATNNRDGGNRRIILVEGEDYADSLTAERIRRVIKGYSFTGTQREELLREPLSFSKLRNANALLEKVQGVETLDGPKFDRIAKTVKDGALIVTGERAIEETAPGLGGEFTNCALGEPIEMDAILSGSALPDEAAMAGLLWHTATATPLAPDAMTETPDIGEGVARLGEFAGRTYWLVYRPDLDWLKSADAALSLTKARAIAATAPGSHLVFTPAKFVSRELLSRERIDVDYAPLPFALYRLETA
jgi:adenine-specific DNA-methyltransferase